MSTRRTRSISAAVSLLVLAAVALPATSAQAATNSWNGSVSGLWSDAGNWSGGAIQVGDDLVFPTGAVRKSLVNDTPINTDFSSLTIQDSGYAMVGGAPELGRLSTTYTSGRSTSSMTTHLTGASGPISVAAGGTFAQTGDLSSDNGLTLSGGGTLELTGTQTYTGAATANYSVLQVDTAMPTPVVLVGATLTGTGPLNGAGIYGSSASTIDPGTVGGPGILTYASPSGLPLNISTRLHIDIEGPTVGTGYDRLALSNGSSLFDPNGAILDVELDYLPALNTNFQIVSQAGGSPITGRFDGIAQFGSYTSGPVTFSVGYFNSGIFLTVVGVNPTTSTWDGGGTTNTWSDAANWVGDTVPARFANLVFPSGAARLSSVNDLATGFEVSSITISAPGYQLAGSSLDLGGTVSANHPAGGSTISLPLNLTGNRSISVGSGATLVIDGAISGTGSGVTKTSPGELRIGSAAVASYTGSTDINAGSLRIDGSIASSSGVSVASGASLAGSGTVPTVTATSGGTVAPTLLVTRDLALNSGATFSVALNGTTPGSGYSRSAAIGTVNLGSATLSAALGFTPTLGSEFMIVSNDGSDPVVGTFNGLPEGSTLTSGSVLLRISYVGGDGNDVVLTADQNAPDAVADAYSPTEDTPLTVAAPGVLGNDSDIENDTLSAVLATAPANGSLSLNTDGSFTYTPSANFAGADSFTYQASDGIALSSAVTVSLTVGGVNDAPIALGDSYAATEDTPLVVTTPTLLANDTDPDADIITAVLTSGPAHGTLALSADGTFTYTPAANYSGTDSFTYRASDGSLISSAATVTLTVGGVNDAPVGAADSVVANMDTPLVVPSPGVLGNDTDIDSSVLTATLVTGVTHGTLVLNADGSFSYTPTAGYTGNDSFSYRTSDGALSGAVTTVTIYVNDIPVGTADTFSVDEDNSLVVPAPGVLGNDTDADSLTAILVTGPAHGTLTLSSNGAFTYIPFADYNGPDSFTYRAFDGSASTNGLVTLNVVSVADAAALPTAGLDALWPLLAAGGLLAVGMLIVGIRRRRLA